MKKNILILTVSLVLITVGCTSPETIIIDSQPVSENFIGHGVEWSAYPHGDSPDAEWGYLMTDEKLEMVYKRLDYMKPRIARVMDVAGWRYFKGVNSKGEPILDFDCPEVQMVCKILDYCQRNGIVVLLGDYGVPGFWGYPGNIDRVDDPRFIEMTTQYVSFLVKEKGFSCIKYYIITNEPNGDWACTRGDWDQWKKGVEMMAEAFANEKLDITMAAPDVVELSNNHKSKYTGWQWVEQSVKQLDHLTGVYNVHCYADYQFIRSGAFMKHYAAVGETIRPTGKPMIFGEIGGWYHTLELGGEYKKRMQSTEFASEDSQLFVYDYLYGVDMADMLIQTMKAGWHGASAWMLDDAMHTIGDLGDKNQLKVWGFWNSLGTELIGDPRHEEIRPWFFTWSLMSRYFTPGMKIYNPTQAEPFNRLRVVAGSSGTGSTIAIVNADEVDHTFDLKMTVNGKSDLDIYDYVESGYQTDENSFPVPVDKVTPEKVKKGFTVTIPARSFKLLTNIPIN